METTASKLKRLSLEAAKFRRSISDSSLLFSGAGFALRLHDLFQGGGDLSEKEVTNIAYNLLGDKHWARKFRYMTLTKIADEVEKDIEKLSKHEFKSDSKPDPEASLGKIALPAMRDFPENVLDFDPNTEKEDELQQMLAKHFKGSQPLKQDDIAYIRAALNNGWYPEVFKEPWDSSLIYRGIGISDAQFEALTGVPLSDVKDPKFYVNKRVKCGLDDAAASWTTSLSVAEEFAYGVPEKIGVVLVARVSENKGVFWDTEALINHENAHEREVIALSDTVKICVVMLS
jgi:hypothetical protein